MDKYLKYARFFIRSFLNFAQKKMIRCELFLSVGGHIPHMVAFRTLILEPITSNDANIIYGNYIWDIRILDSWIYVPLLGCGNVFSFDDVSK